MTGSMGLEIRGIRRIEPREPRSMTLADPLVLVGGVGISLAIRPFIPVSHWLIIAAPVVWFL